MKKLLFVVMGMVAASAMADITLDGATFVSSDTTVSEKVTGSGYYVVTGGATLTLANAGNDFTGGILISNGVAKANAAGAFGSGRIDVCEAKSQVIFNAAGTYANDIVQRANNGWSMPTPGISAYKNVTLSGDISFDYEGLSSSSYMGIGVGKSGDTSTVVTMTITGTVNAGIGRIIVYGYEKNQSSKVVFKEKVTTSVLYAGANSSNLGQIELWEPSNEIGSLGVKLMQVRCMAADVFKGAAVNSTGSSLGLGANRALIFMNGWDQHVAGIDGQGDGEVDSSTWNGRTDAFYTTADKPATLTISCTGNKRSDIAFIGPINIVMNNPDGHSDKGQYFTRRSSCNTGKLDIQNGYVRLENGVRFVNLTNLAISSTSKVITSSISDAMPNLGTLKVDGRLEFDAASKSPLGSTSARCDLGANAVLVHGAGVTNTVRKLYVGGAGKRAGTYTKENLAQMSTSADDGALVVTRSVKGLRVSIR